MKIYVVTMENKKCPCHLKVSIFFFILILCYINQVEQMISEAETLHTGHEKQPRIPLVRVKVRFLLSWLFIFTVVFCLP